MSDSDAKSTIGDSASSEAAVTPAFRVLPSGFPDSTPAFRPSVPVVQIQAPYLHYSTLALTSRFEGAVGVNVGSHEKTLFLTVQVRESQIDKLSDHMLLEFKDCLLRELDSRLTAALGL